MDATEAYMPNASASKATDGYFDFAEAPDNGYKSMKSLGVYIEPNNNNNNNENEVKPVGKDCGVSNNINNGINFDNSMFWSDKESMKLESGILDDINSWNDWSDGKSVPDQNTDGTVYTLTVLNSHDSWYKAPVDNKIKKQENLDIDSFLNIIPEAEGSDPSGYYYPEYQQGPQQGPPPPPPPQPPPPPSERHNGFADGKDMAMNPVVNNNDWKATNNNVNDSLLRNALQGKAFQRTYPTVCKKGIRDEGNSQYAESSQQMMMNPSQYGMEENSTNNIDDILGLSTIDTFSEDYEKIKKIANEVADCAKFTMNELPMCSNDMFMIANNNMDGLMMDTRVNNVQNSAITQGKCGGKKYAKKGVANVNLKTSSNGTRKERSLHYCSICAKGFKDKYSVNVHVRTHTGEKPFTCNLCGKSFRQKAHLAKHYQTHLAQSQKHIGNGNGGGSGGGTGSGSAGSHSKSRSHHHHHHHHHKVLSPTEQHR